MFVDADFLSTEMQHGTEVCPYFELVLLYYNIIYEIQCFCVHDYAKCLMWRFQCASFCWPTNLPIFPVTLHNRWNVRRCTPYVPQNNITYNDSEVTLQCHLSKYILHEYVIFGVWRNLSLPDLIVEARTQSPSLIRLYACHMSSDSSGIRVTLLKMRIMFTWKTEFV